MSGHKLHAAGHVVYCSNSTPLWPDGSLFISAGDLLVVERPAAQHHLHALRVDRLWGARLSQTPVTWSGTQGGGGTDGNSSDRSHLHSAQYSHELPYQPWIKGKVKTATLLRSGRLTNDHHWLTYHDCWSTHIQDEDQCILYDTTTSCMKRCWCFLNIHSGSWDLQQVVCKHKHSGVINLMVWICGTYFKKSRVSKSVLTLVLCCTTPFQCSCISIKPQWRKQWYLVGSSGINDTVHCCILFFSLRSHVTNKVGTNTGETV